MADGQAFRLPKQERTYTTLLMATGLTFGSISALYGLTHNLINESQYTELVTVVILSAFVPTLSPSSSSSHLLQSPLMKKRHWAKKTFRFLVVGKVRALRPTNSCGDARPASSPRANRKVRARLHAACQR